MVGQVIAIHLRAISQEVRKVFILDMRSKFINLKLQALPGANELIITDNVL